MRLEVAAISDVTGRDWNCNRSAWKQCRYREHEDLTTTAIADLVRQVSENAVQMETLVMLGKNKPEILQSNSSNNRPADV